MRYDTLRYLFLLGIMGEWVFFLTLSFFNYQYAGSNESNFYVFYWILIFILSLVVFGLSLLNYIKLGKMPKYFIVNILPIFIVIILYLISFSVYGYNDTGNGYYAKVFVSMCVPTFIIGYICATKNKENQLIDIVIKFITLGTGILIISLYRLVTTNIGVGSLDSIGGVGRLGIGYLATQFFIVTFYIFLFSHRMENSNLSYLFKSRIKFILICIMLAIQVSTVIFSGSRGPLLNLILVAILMLLVRIFQNNLISFIKKLLSITLIILGFVFIFNNFAKKYFVFSTERTLTLFELDKDSWAGGSGRESLYSLAMDMFSNKPFFGYGPMGFLSSSGTNMYPHNLFLESIVDYGLVGLLIITLFFIFLIKKYIKKIKLNKNLLLILFLFTSSLIELQVSGTFIANARLWFFIGLGMGFININRLNLKGRI